MAGERGGSCTALHTSDEALGECDADRLARAGAADDFGQYGKEIEGSDDSGLCLDNL
jgi:hypothetical protein